MINKIRTVAGIHGVPRSGTSWLGQLINSHPLVAFRFQPLFSYAFKNYLTLHSTERDINNFFDLMLSSDDYFINMKDPKIHKNYPAFEKDPHSEVLVYKEVRYHYLVPHLLNEHKTIKFVLLIRNPLSVLTSWAKAPREFKPEWVFGDEWLRAEKKNQNRAEEYFGFEKWREAAHLFLECKKNHPDRVQLISYNDLLQNTDSLIQHLLGFLGLDFCEQTRSFIEQSRKQNHQDPNSVYKIKVNDLEWKGFIPENIIKQIHDDLNGTSLAAFLE